MNDGKVEPATQCRCCRWQDNAQFGDHIWFETSGSGDFCYVGEQYCVAKSLVSHSAPLWLKTEISLLPLPQSPNGSIFCCCVSPVCPCLAAKVCGEEEMCRVQDLRPHHVHGAVGEGLERRETRGGPNMGG